MFLPAAGLMTSSSFRTRCTALSALLGCCLFMAASASVPTAHADSDFSPDFSEDLHFLHTSWTDEPAQIFSLQLEDSRPDLEFETASLQEVSATSSNADARPVHATIGEPIKAEKEKSRRFHKALRERDLSIGYGRKINASRFNGRTDVEMYQLLPRWGRFRNDNQEFLWEVPITYATSPDNAYAAGLTLMFRHHFSSSRNFAPFVEIGSGIAFTNFDDKFKEVSGSFQFTPQAGIGFRKSFGKSGDLVASARFFHMSNAGLKAPNTGLNNYLITVGYSKLF